MFGGDDQLSRNVGLGSGGGDARCTRVMEVVGDQWAIGIRSSCEIGYWPWRSAQLAEIQ